MTIAHRPIEIMPGITFCTCLICQTGRLRAVARVADKHPQHAGQVACIFAELTEKAAIASGQVAEVPAEEQ